MTGETFSRRQLLAGGAAGAAALGMAKVGHVRSRGAATVRSALQVKPAGSDLGAVKHVVFHMQENRSFDHYFGTMGGVRGFDDTANRGSFNQNWPGGSTPTLLPFHMDTRKSAECTYDLSHSWQAEHASWNGGSMDSFVSTHTSNQYEGNLGVNTMGYYKRGDVPFYRALAEQFTVCDNYFCSVLGPTHPNRLMQMTGTLDPGASAGGPILVTNSDQSGKKGTCSWQTMPEVLQSNNISWKCYNPHGSNYQPGASFFISKNMLLYFKQYLADPSSSLYKNAFEFYGPAVSGGLTDGTSPNDFASDVMNNTLPQVSWILSPDSYDEHPPAPAALGEWYTQQILDTLLSNPAVWASTVLFIMHDENDGFFDHVPPPTPPSGTAGEYLASPLPSDAGGIDGPVGMGVRVPMIVVSPFSAGGYVCHDTFDHTSQLKFLETLFNVSAPNISNWRRSVTGDLTASLPVLDAAVTKAPRLPATSSSTTAPPVGGECSPAQILELNPATAPLPFWKHHQMPKQSTRTLKPTPS